VSAFVLDASVVIKWFVPEIHSDRAKRLLETANQYVAPDLLFAEVGNTIWKKVRRGELKAEDARRLAEEIPGIALETIPTRGLLADAEALAIATGLTVYDALYVTLAIRMDISLITADERLGRALVGYPDVAAHVRSVQTLD